MKTTPSAVAAWKLVPIKPTASMLHALGLGHYVGGENAYRAMLEAAPNATLEEYHAATQPEANAAVAGAKDHAAPTVDQHLHAFKGGWQFTPVERRLMEEILRLREEAKASPSATTPSKALTAEDSDAMKGPAR